MKQKAILITVFVLAIMAGIAGLLYNYPLQTFTIICIPALCLLTYRLYQFIYGMLEEIQNESN